MTIIVSIQGLRYIMQRFGLLVLFGFCLFASAGSLDWPRAWATLSVSFVCELVVITLLMLRAPETLNQRGTSHQGIETFDIVFAVAWIFLNFSLAVVAGLDCVRYGTTSFSWGLFGLGAFLLCIAVFIGTWAMLENKYFEQFVRVQRDRNHRVVTSGPYQIVRHPGYVAAILAALASPLLLGSVWSFIPAILIAALFVWRASREDQTLIDHLEGYAQYKEKTLFRLIPYIW